MIPISLKFLLLQAFIGLSLGTIYAMMASGLSLIFGLMRVVNFAHGSFYMLGAYTLVYLISLIGNFWICLIVAPIIIGIIGILIEMSWNPASLRDRGVQPTPPHPWVELRLCGHHPNPLWPGRDREFCPGGA